MYKINQQQGNQENPSADNQPVLLTATTGASNVVLVNIRQAAPAVICDTLNFPSTASFFPKAISTPGFRMATSTGDCNVGAAAIKNTAPIADFSNNTTSHVSNNHTSGVSSVYPVTVEYVSDKILKGFENGLSLKGFENGLSLYKLGAKATIHLQKQH